MLRSWHSSKMPKLTASASLVIRCKIRKFLAAKKSCSTTQTNPTAMSCNCYCHIQPYHTKNMKHLWQFWGVHMYVHTCMCLRRCMEKCGKKISTFFAPNVIAAISQVKSMQLISQIRDNIFSMHSEVAIAARVNRKILWLIWAAWMSPICKCLPTLGLHYIT
jgi:hypothetical protein